jgi:hypothetical protein
MKWEEEIETYEQEMKRDGEVGKGDGDGKEEEYKIKKENMEETII